jgi:hypothetical protein
MGGEVVAEQEQQAPQEQLACKDRLDYRAQMRRHLFQQQRTQQVRLSPTRNLWPIFTLQNRMFPLEQIRQPVRNSGIRSFLPAQPAPLGRLELAQWDRRVHLVFPERPGAQLAQLA